MRMRRILIDVVALALLGLAPLSLAGTASAAEAEIVDRASTASSARALPKRDIASNIADKGNRLIFKGNVNPGHAHKAVFIQKKACKGERCDWHKFKRVETNDKGGFRARITAPRDGYWYWRAKVKAHGGYGTSYSDVWRTYTI